jgi:hypothetical protein
LLQLGRLRKRHWHVRQKTVDYNQPKYDKEPLLHITAFERFEDIFPIHQVFGPTVNYFIYDSISYAIPKEAAWLAASLWR